ncbi:septal ring lytic transglycosylase RlpA family protein [Rhizobium sp. GN54]|uniref:septal ring lytic transglycosylase RlpA family protein n=1 Tax=Rhizobium sp. GN54 TaxID=2898150 RepID=UPI001E33699F|nr:septal ring lytic transglycosylase RlpA family protein [Rhizobium sp. GN54]MCD2185282.1 septal ring lytic transglycosylase RlpA family protein [Rhizobium sp. GN54]
MNFGFFSAGARTAFRLVAIPVVCAGLASCNTTSETAKKAGRSKEYFAESEYGVKASPRVVQEGQAVPKGGGRYQVGKPYKVRGKWYKPQEDPGYDKVGLASWYGSAFHGRKTANGEIYDKYHLSAAHPTFPLPSYARVTNLENGTSVIVRVNDRGPYSHGRIIDVSSKTAEMLDVKGKGTAKVRVQYVGKARLDGHDMPYLMASYVPKGSRVPAVDPGGQIATGVMVASAAPMADSLPAAVPTFAERASEGEAGSAMTALAEQAPASAAFSAMYGFAMLPEIGPIPGERPDFVPRHGDGASFAAAYAETPAAGGSVEAFDAVLRQDGSLVLLSGSD